MKVFDRREEESFQFHRILWT